MKKTFFKSLMIAALIVPTFTACELDQYPTTSIPGEKSWEKPSDATNFDKGLYATLRRNLSNVGALWGDILMDYFQPTISYGNRGGLLYTWTYSANDVGGPWASGFSAISDCNYFLTNVDRIDYSKSKDRANDSILVRQYKGEAHFIRALAYSNIVSYYCQSYDAGTAATTRGLPLLTKVDVSAKPRSANLKATYEFILNDLNMADDLLQASEPGTDPVLGQIINKTMTKALRARVLLNMGDYTNALAEAESLINSGYFALANSANALRDMWTNDQGSEFIYVPAGTPDERFEYGSSANDNNFRSYSQAAGAYSPDWIPSKSTVDMYSATDWRTDIFLDKQNVKCQDQKASNIALFNKFLGNPNLRKTGDSRYARYNLPKLFRIAETYLIAAEAAYRLNDAAKAQQYLNALRTKRGLLATVETGESLAKEIRLEWKREFMGEGMYFRVLKRWGVGFQRDAATQTGAANVVYTGNAAANISLKVEPTFHNNWTFEIPTQEKSMNPNIESFD